MTPAPDARAGSREWIGLAVIALPCLVYAMDMTVLNLAIPALSAELRPSSAQLLWIIDIYGFFVAGFLITMGTLGDRIGRRKLLLIGAAAFAAASLLAAFARSAEMLIAMRALLGVAGATLAPSTLSLIRNMFHHEHERQFAIGVWIAAFSVGGAIGPLVGGVMLQWFSWGSVFLLAVPVMALLLLLGPSLLPEYKDPHAGRLDLASALLSLGAVLAMIYGLKRIAEEQALAWGPAAVLLAGVALAAAFVHRQGRIDYPLLDLKLFRRPTFSAAIAAYALSCLAMLGVYIFVTQYLQLVLGLSPLIAGLATVPSALGFTLGSLTAPRLARRLTPAAVFVWGLAFSALGFALLTLAGGPHGLPAAVVGTTIMSLGMAPVFTVGNELIITAAPPERAGAASAISETSAEFSGALGIAVFGSIGTVFYRATLGGAMPAGVPPEAAGAALDTLGGAVAAAQALPGAAGAALLATARAAFVDALQFAALAATAICLAASVLAARMLRNTGGGGRRGRRMPQPMPAPAPGLAAFERPEPPGVLDCADAPVRRPTMDRRRLLLAATLALPMTALAAPAAMPVSLDAARASLAAGDALLIDIREPDEHALGVAPEARRLPLSQIAQRMGEIPKDRPVLLICRTQNRSSRLAQALREQGYDNVRYVDGGMKAWEERGYTTVPPR